MCTVATNLILHVGKEIISQYWFPLVEKHDENIGVHKYLFRW
jgi:hypothetical protein